MGFPYDNRHLMTYFNICIMCLVVNLTDTLTTQIKCEQGIVDI